MPRSAADVWAAGVGALTGDRFEALVAEGLRVQEAGGRAVRGAVQQVESAVAAIGEQASTAVGQTVGEVSEAIRERVEHAVEAILGTAGLPSRDEVERLRAQVHRVQSRLSALTGEATVYETFAVEPHPDGWAVRRSAGPHVASVHSTKKEALQAGRRLARASAPSHLVVFRADGTPGETMGYESRG